MLNSPINVKWSQGRSLLPTKMWESLRTEIDGLFDRFSPTFETREFRPFEYFWPRNAGSFASFNVDVYKTEKAYVITAEIPGVDEKSLEVEVSEDALIVKGEKIQEIAEDMSLYFSERYYGAFERTFALPKDADRKNIVAKYVHGVLTITMPRVAVAQNLHRIHVKAA